MRCGANDGMTDSFYKPVPYVSYQLHMTAILCVHHNTEKRLRYNVYVRLSSVADILRGLKEVSFHCVNLFLAYWLSTTNLSYSLITVGRLRVGR